MATASGYVVFAYPHEYSSKYCLHTHMRTTPKLEKCLHTVCKGTDMRTCMCLCVCVCVCVCVHVCMRVCVSYTVIRIMIIFHQVVSTAEIKQGIVTFWKALSMLHCRATP